MQFRSFDDMSNTIRHGLHALPAKVDVVVGIPRSGMVPALMVALYRNTMVTDLDGLFEGRPLDPGSRREKPGLVRDPTLWRNVVIVDDSIDSGETIRTLRATIAERRPELNVFVCAVYGTAPAYEGVDLVLEQCARPRIFEWNMLHHPDHLKRTCFDIDGVLCVDPTQAQNDDGPAYTAFVRGAVPLFIPTVPISTLVTSRLEKYRAETEDWLHRAGVRYEALHMVDLPSAAERRRLGVHASFKAEVYRSLSDHILFLESDRRQAPEIARLSGKAVICIDDMTFHGDSSLTVLRQRGATFRRKVARRLSGLIGMQHAR